MKKYLISAVVLVLVILGYALYGARYPSSYYRIKKGMTEEQVRDILSDDKFVFQRQFGRFEGVWVRKQVIGKWVVDCGFDTKGKLWSTSFWYHVEGCGEYVRARSSSF